MVDKLSPMQQEILARYDQIINSISTTVNKAASVAADQIPDIAKEYIAYGRISNTVTMFLIVTLWVACVIVLYKMLIPQKETSLFFSKDGSWTEGRVAITICSFMTLFIMSIFFCANISDLIMVYAAPKVWLLREITSLAKSV